MRIQPTPCASHRCPAYRPHHACKPWHCSCPHVSQISRALVCTDHRALRRGGAGGARALRSGPQPLFHGCTPSPRARPRLMPGQHALTMTRCGRKPLRDGHRSFVKGWHACLFFQRARSFFLGLPITVARRSAGRLYGLSRTRSQFRWVAKLLLGRDLIFKSTFPQE